MPRDPAKPRRCVLHPNIEPFGLSREEAAEAYTVSPTKFDSMVRDGRAPPPKVIDGRLVWDVGELRVAWAKLPYRDQTGGIDNPWDRP